MDILFSIVMPCFNSFEFVQDAIDSVRMQDYTNYELIVIDGGSDDGTLDVLQSNRDVIDILVSEPDGGQSEAMIKGFSRAKGDYFLWLNADDLIMPSLLSKANDLINSSANPCWINFGTIIVKKDKSINRFIGSPPWLGFVNKLYRPQISSPTTIFHKSLYHSSGGFDKRFHFTMDVDLWRTFIENGYKWINLKCYGIAFREHENSKTNKGDVPCHISDVQLSEATLMTEKHKLLNDVILYRSISKFWRIINCYIRDCIHNIIWRNRLLDCYINKQSQQDYRRT